MKLELKNVSRSHASVVVVDPGVGSYRKAIVIDTEERGYLNKIVRNLRVSTRDWITSSNFNKVYISEDGIKTTSDVFHGRYVFASTALRIDRDNFKDLVKIIKLEDLIKSFY